MQRNKTPLASYENTYLSDLHPFFHRKNSNFFTVNEYLFQLQFEISEFIDTIVNYYQLIIVKSGFSSQNYILQILYIPIIEKLERFGK